MKRMVWIAQNEDTDADGFLVSGKDAFEAERRELTELGCPEPELIQFFAMPVHDRDTCECWAECTERTAEWLEQELDAEPWNPEFHGLWIAE